FGFVRSIERRRLTIAGQIGSAQSSTANTTVHAAQKARPWNRLVFAGCASGLALGGNVMRHVLIVVSADHLHDVVLLRLHFQGHAPRLSEIHWVLIGDLPQDAVRRGLGENFGDVQLVTVLVAGGVEPTAFTDASGIDGESVGLVPADGIAVPGRVLVLGVWAAVGENTAEGVVDLEEY